MINFKRTSIYLLLILLFVSNYSIQIRAETDNNEDSGYYYIYECVDEETYKLSGIETKFEEDLDIEQKINKLFALLSELKYNENQITLLPESTKLLSCISDEGKVELNFSKEFINYGGTAWEKGLVEQVLTTAFSLAEVKEVTIFIDSEKIPLVEGTEVYGYTRENIDKEK